MSRPTTFRLRFRLRPVLGLLAAACFLAFTVAQAPHLVHHAFEPSKTDCAFASAGDRAQEFAAETATLILPPAAEPGGPVIDQSPPASPALASADARAPPLAS